MTYEELLNLTDELSKYSMLEVTELGECCTALITLSSYMDYISKDFQEALIKELQSALKYFKNNFDIVVHKEVVEQLWEELEEKD